LVSWFDLKYKTPNTAVNTARTMSAILEVLLLDSIMFILFIKGFV